MPNQNLKAWQYRAYDMLSPTGSARTLNFTPPQVAVQQTVSGATTGMTAVTINVTAPQTSAQNWFYNPAQASVTGDQTTVPLTVEMYIINQSQQFEITLTMVLATTSTSQLNVQMPLRPNEVITVPTNCIAITGITAGNTLNNTENSIIVPLPGPTDLVTLDFVVIV